MTDATTHIARLLRIAPLRLLLGLAMTALLMTTSIPAAHAGELGRTCKRYYSSGNPQSSWNFELCIKFIHDTSTHSWYATGKITSATPGVKLYLDDVYLEMRTAEGANEIARLHLNPPTQSLEPSATFVTGDSYRQRCSDLYPDQKGEIFMMGVIDGHVIWPNGVPSQYVGFSTGFNGEYVGNC